MSSIRERLVAVAMGLLAAAAHGQSTDDFARQWPIQAAEDEGLLRVELSAEIYATLSRSTLGDLGAFNADGVALAIDTLGSPGVLPGPPERSPLPLFRLPAADATGAPERIALHIARGEDGRLRQLQAEVGPDPTSAQAGEVLVLDAGAVPHAVQTLIVDLDAGVDTLDARVEVQLSHDLAQWVSAGGPQALVRLHQNGLLLERTRLHVGAVGAPYLRLLRRDGDAPLPIAAVRAEGAPSRIERSSEPVWLTLPGQPDPDRAGRFRYASPGPLPVDRLQLAPGQGAGAFGVRVYSQVEATANLHLRAQQVVFRVGAGVDALGSDRIVVPGPVRDRAWVIDTEPAQTVAPTFEVGFVPEQMLILAQPPGPYRLAAGSARAERPAIPLAPVLEGLRARHGADWLPPLSPLGTATELAGARALEVPPEPIPWRQVLLWAVLVGGGLLVVGLVLSLLRGEPDHGP